MLILLVTLRSLPKISLEKLISLFNWFISSLKLKQQRTLIFKLISMIDNIYNKSLVYIYNR